MRIGLVSDTHLPGELRHLGQLGPQIEAFLGSVDLILHGGDIAAPSVLDWLEQFAPVIAARGNNDGFDGDSRVRPLQFLQVEGWRIGMRHDLDESKPVDHLSEHYFAREQVDIMICGHTHHERVQYRDGVMIVNSGSPILPHNFSTRLGTVGLLEVTRDELSAEIVVLGHSEGKRNPGVPMSLRVRDGQVVGEAPGGLGAGPNGAAALRPAANGDRPA